MRYVARLLVVVGLLIAIGSIASRLPAERKLHDDKVAATVALDHKVQRLTAWRDVKKQEYTKLRDDASYTEQLIRERLHRIQEGEEILIIE